MDRLVIVIQFYGMQTKKETEYFVLPCSVLLLKSDFEFWFSKIANTNWNRNILPYKTKQFSYLMHDAHCTETLVRISYMLGTLPKHSKAAVGSYHNLAIVCGIYYWHIYKYGTFTIFLRLKHCFETIICICIYPWLYLFPFHIHFKRTHLQESLSNSAFLRTFLSL